MRIGFVKRFGTMHFEATPDLIITLLYILFVVCIIYPPPEFISAGVTIPMLFSSFLGSENEDFIRYQLKRTVLTLFVYSFLPALYILIILVFGDQDGLKVLLFADMSLLRLLIFTPSILLPLGALGLYYSYQPDNEHHPLVLNLKKFCNNNSNWKTIASDINTEFRSVDKFCIQTNPISRIIVTENWIIKISPINIFLTHQSDASLVVKESDTHALSYLNSGVEEQFVTIEVKSTRAKTFNIRLNSADFRDLQNRISRTIFVPSDIRIHKNVVEKFIDAFKEAIKENETYTPTQDIEMCLGCMQTLSNVKLQKMCVQNTCTTCYCKPMWCADCMGRWFAHRQDLNEVHKWLSAQCTCPMCRATFCVLDVCPINTE